MALESIDLVHKNHWLICVKGPKITVTNPFDESQSIIIDHSMEGCLARVLAINPPIMLLKLYLTPGSKKTKKYPVKWGVAGWIKANKSYVRAYLKKLPVSKTPIKGTPVLVIENPKRPPLRPE